MTTTLTRNDKTEQEPVNPNDDPYFFNPDRPGTFCRCTECNCVFHTENELCDDCENGDHHR